MIARMLLVFAALQAPVPRTLAIRSGDLSTPVPVIETARGAMVKLEQTLGSLGAALVRSGTDRYRLVVGGADVELTVGVAVARLRSRSEPLPAPPAIFEGQLLVPLALLTDLIPRVAVGYAYDRATSELTRVTQAVAAALPPPTERRSPPAKPTKQRHRVVIDAGHGGPDRGMQGPLGSPNKILEKDITLAIAKRVRDALKARSVDVVMTRTTDTLIALGDRGRIANDAGADLFVSVHVNAANPRWREPGAARGFETYFLSEAKTEDERRVEVMENEVIKFELADSLEPGDPLALILADMRQNEYLRESGDLADAVQAGLRRVHPGPSRGVKQAGFLVLVKAFMPAVLVEVGFGTNREEASLLASEGGQVTLATAIVDGILEYLDRLDRRTTGVVAR